MSFINVQEWNVQQVADWVSGLEPTLHAYSIDLINRQINGAKLLNFMAGDLERIGISKVGDQLILHDAIQSLRNEMESDRVTLQSLASQLAVRCKTYRSELSNLPKRSSIPTQSLSTAAYMLDAAKTLLRWLTSFPFLGNLEYDNISKQLNRHCFELALLSQRDSFADNASEEVQYLCTKAIQLCDNIIESKDSLVMQPAAADVITIRKRHEQNLGLQFESSYFGIHIICGVVLNSPAHQSGHLERGDEILQINYQTIIGWAQASVIALLHENPCEVVLTVKRRPRHAVNLLGHMYLKPNRVPHRKIVSPVIEEVFDKELGIGHGTHHVIKQISAEKAATISSITTTEPTPIIVEVTVPAPEPSPSVTNAETRFWKLYPRPTNLLRRRASVSGASPTSTRPPVTFVEDHSQAIAAVSRRPRPPLDKSKSESNKLDVEEQDDRMMKFVSDGQGNRITLPIMEPTPYTETQSESVQPNVEIGKAESVQEIKQSAPLPSIAPNSSRDMELTSSDPGEPQPIYTSYLHERAQWKFGPRWNRFKCTLYPKLLVVGSHSFKMGKDDFKVALAVEVHSRPFAFKLEQCKPNQEKSVIYVAAESHREMEIWIRKLCVETEQPYPLDGGTEIRSYRRSFSLQSPVSEGLKPSRRCSLPQKNELTNRVQTRYKDKVGVRTEFGKHKSQSTSRLDQRPSIQSYSSGGSPYSSNRSNISSITITSVKRQNSKSPVRCILKQTSPIYNNAVNSQPTLSRSHVDLNLHGSSNAKLDELNGNLMNDNQKSNYNPTAKPRHSLSSSATLPRKSSLSYRKTAPPDLDVHSPGNLNEGSKCLGVVEGKNICTSCGSRIGIHVVESSTQTDDNFFIVFTDDQPSSLV